jgi:hypothetical protein
MAGWRLPLQQFLVMVQRIRIILPIRMIPPMRLTRKGILMLGQKLPILPPTLREILLRFLATMWRIRIIPPIRSFLGFPRKPL